VKYLVVAVEDDRVDFVTKKIEELRWTRGVKHLLRYEADPEFILDKDGDVWQVYGTDRNGVKHYTLVADPTSTETLATIVNAHGPVWRARLDRSGEGNMRRYTVLGMGEDDIQLDEEFTFRVTKLQFNMETGNLEVVLVRQVKPKEEKSDLEVKLRKVLEDSDGGIDFTKAAADAIKAQTEVLKNINYQLGKIGSNIDNVDDALRKPVGGTPR